MSDNKNKRTGFFSDKLRNKFRLVILNDETFAETFSFRLSRLGLIILITSVTIVMTTLVISLVAFTSLREYIPGYGNISERKELLDLTVKTDSLEQVLSSRDWYIKNIMHVFSDSLERKTDKPAKDTTGKYKKINIKPSKNDIKFREDVEKEPSSLQFSSQNTKQHPLSNYLFFPPVKGFVTTSFNIAEEHYGVDIVAKKDDFIKSALDGTVVFTGFTIKDGYVIQIQHDNNLMSTYKHNSSLLKKTGDRVKSGEPISVIGNTGEESNGPHLHFELWHNGLPVNPEDFILF